MPIEFINPNWHVVLIHYPIALLTMGLVVEIISVFKPKGGFRAAGRWMIAIGAVLAVPTLTSGLYAFRDTVSDDAISMGDHWYDLAHSSRWNDTQWQFMSRHVWFNAIATALVLLIVFLWLANPDRIRRKLYWLLLPALIAACGLMGAGAWHSGEAVYRYGTAVQAVNPNPPSEDFDRDQDYYAHPLQVHLVLAGLAVSASIVGMALMLRKWEKPQVANTEEDLLGSAARRRATDPLREDPARDRYEQVEASLGPFGETTVAVSGPPRVYPGWFYFGATILALGTAFFGAWSMLGSLQDNPLKRLVEEIKEPDHRRLLWHTVFGVSIVTLPLVIGLLVRVSRRGRLLPLALTGLLLLAILMQMWIGIAILFDGHEGPVWRFERAGTATETSEQHHDSHAAIPTTTRRSVTTSSATTRAVH
jgi:uncharacterized membrane protein